MKKKIVLFSCSIALLSGLIMSNNAGPITLGAGNRTGSQNSTANCSTGGCHAANSVATQLLVTLEDTSTGNTVTSWVPGQTYNVVLSGGNLTKTKYGFQLSAVSGNGAGQVQAGTFSNAPANTAIKTSGTLSIIEHTTKLDITSAQFSMTAYWTAPANTVDTVKFYATVNAVDDNSSTSGDQPNNLMIKYPNQTLSVGQLNADIKIAAYPNPVTDKLNISLENAGTGTYTIRVFDMNGKVVANQSANVTKSYSTSINTTSWASGMYHVQLQKDGAQRTIAVMKH